MFLYLYGAFAHVRKLILSDMGLDDASTLAPLSTLRNLEYLNLDRNKFKHRVQGLELLGNTTKLHTFSMQFCIIRKMTRRSLFNKQLTKLPLLKALNLQTEFVNRCFKPPISYEFLEVLFKLDSFIQPNGDPKGVSMVAGDTRNYVFD